MKLLTAWMLTAAVTFVYSEELKQGCELQDKRRVLDIGHRGGLDQGSHAYLGSSIGGHVSSQGYGGGHETGKTTPTVGGSHGEGFGVSLGYGGGQSYQKTVVITNQVPVPESHPVPVQVVKNVRVPVPKAIPYPVDRQYPVPVEKSYPVAVERPVSYTVERKVPYPVRVPFRVAVLYPVPYQITKPVAVPVGVPAKYSAYKNVPFYAQSHSYGGGANYNYPFHRRFGGDYSARNVRGYHGRSVRHHW